MTSGNAKTGRSTTQRLEDKLKKPVIINDESSSESEEEDPQPVVKKKKKKVRVASPEAEDIDDDFPELPFEKTPAVAYVPLGHNRRPEHENIPNLEPKETSYRQQAPVEDPVESLRMMERLLETPITVTARELMSASKEVRDFFRSKVTKKRVPLDKKTPYKAKTVNLTDTAVEENEIPEDALAYWESYFEASKQLENLVEIEELPKATYSITSSTKGNVPAGSVVLDDPVSQYYDSLAPGEIPQTIYVARESQGLRTVYPVINKALEEEAVLDGGSQIVSMAKEVALKNGLAWDPDIVIHMQSANKQVEKTLGLARNVPFVFKDITLYLQVHVVNEPAYRVLLGRPFDSLTESVVQNDRDGGQVITITDPNTGRRTTLPTFMRGKPPDIRTTQPKAVFQHSMNWSRTKENY